MPLTSILIVDDDRDDHDFFCAAVAEVQPDIGVKTFGDGESLLGFLQNNAVDLLFLDINMSPVNGMEALKAIRENETFRNMPVIMFSSSGRPDDVLQSYKLGAHLFIRKTETFDGLKLILKKALALDWSVPEKVRARFHNTCFTA